MSSARASVYPASDDEVIRDLFSELKKPKRFPMRALYSNMRKELSKLRGHAEMLLPFFRHVLLAMVHVTVVDGHTAWKSYWKAPSSLGYDVVRNRCIDYGNKEYNTLLYAFLMLDETMWAQYYQLGRFWPSLLVIPSQTEHQMNMQGDVVEILLAATRAHMPFGTIPEEYLRPGCLPRLTASLCSMCRTVQLINAYCHTGTIKFRNYERVPTILSDTEFARRWLRDPHTMLAMLMRG